MDSETYTSINEGGIRLKSYLDSRGNWTVGVGCKDADPYHSPDPVIGPSTVWTAAQCKEQYAIRLAAAELQARADLGAGAWEVLDNVRRAALTDMAFNLGGAGLAHFPCMLAAIRAQSWQACHDACLNSQYAAQVPARARHNASIFLTGQWPAVYGQ